MSRRRARQENYRGDGLTPLSQDYVEVAQHEEAFDQHILDAFNNLGTPHAHIYGHNKINLPNSVDPKKGVGIIGKSARLLFGVDTIAISSGIVFESNRATDIAIEKLGILHKGSIGFAVFLDRPGAMNEAQHSRAGRLTACLNKLAIPSLVLEIPQDAAPEIEQTQPSAAEKIASAIRNAEESGIEIPPAWTAPRNN